MNIGDKIKFLRQAEGLSYRELSARIGISISRLHDIENSINTPTLTTASKILNYFGYQIEFKEIPTIKKMKEIIKARLEVIGDCNIEVKHIEELTDNAVLATFRFYPKPKDEARGVDGISSAVYYTDDDYLFHQQDWQGSYPKSLEEIKEFSWVSQDGREAMVLKDLPGLLF